MTEPQIPQQIQVHLDWGAANEIPAVPVNKFAMVIGPHTNNGIPDGIFLILGNVVPPIIVGDNNTELKRKSIEAAQQAGLHVDVYGRYHLSRDRLSDLIEGLQATARTYDLAARSLSETETKE